MSNRKVWFITGAGRGMGVDFAKAALALMTIVEQDRPPLRFIAGADAIATAEQTIATLQRQIDALRDLSSSLAFEEGARKGRREDSARAAHRRARRPVSHPWEAPGEGRERSDAHAR
jgi:NAD(P)-dependent dehydrogenase (short-subunit alcohol dehydrogenase family)